MSRENVETLRRALDAFNARDKAAWMAECDPEAENFPPRDWPENSPIHGPSAIWDFYVEAIKAWDGAEFSWGEFIDDAPGSETIVANQRAELRGKTSGVEVIWTYWVVFAFRDGRVLRSEWFADRAEAVAAAGLNQA
jgi:ketosteroid isomerase-like protein